MTTYGERQQIRYPAGTVEFECKEYTNCMPLTEEQVHQILIDHQEILKAYTTDWHSTSKTLLNDLTRQFSRNRSHPIVYECKMPYKLMQTVVRPFILSASETLDLDFITERYNAFFNIGNAPLHKQMALHELVPEICGPGYYLGLAKKCYNKILKM
jgi:hypothetical protein